MHSFYEKSCNTFTHFGLSAYYNMVMILPRAVRERTSHSTKNHKLEMGRYVLDWWEMLFNIQNCNQLEEHLILRNNTNRFGLMQVKEVRINTSDAPWVTQKSLIMTEGIPHKCPILRSSEFIETLSTERDGERKLCKATYFKVHENWEPQSLSERGKESNLITCSFYTGDIG